MSFLVAPEELEELLAHGILLEFQTDTATLGVSAPLDVVMTAVHTVRGESGQLTSQPGQPNPVRLYTELEQCRQSLGADWKSQFDVVVVAVHSVDLKQWLEVLLLGRGERARHHFLCRCVVYEHPW